MIKKTDILILICLITLTTMLYAFNYDKGISLHDEGRDVSAFVKVIDGKMPYRDFRWVHGPLALYLHSLMFKLCGINLLFLRQALVIVALLVMVCSYLLARFILPPVYSGIAALLAIGYYGFPQYTSNHMYGTLCGLLAVIFMLKFFLVESKPHYIAVAGVLTGLIFGFMQAMGVFVWTAIALYTASRRSYKSLLNYTVCAATTAFAIYFYFIINVPWNLLYENLNPRWRLKLMGGIGVFPSLFVIFQKGLSLDSFNLWRNALLFWLPPISTAIVTILLLSSVRKHLFNSKAENKVLLLFVIYQAIMLIRLFIDKGVEWVVFSAQTGMILLVYILYLVMTRYKQGYPQVVVVLRFAFFTGMILLYFIEIAPFSIAHYYSFKDDYKLPFKRAPIYVNYQIGKTLIDSVDYIKQNTSPHDKLICAVYSPMINFLAERENPLYDNELTPGVFKNSEMEVAAIETIKSSRVKYFSFITLTHAYGQQEGWGPYIFGKDYAVSLFEFIKSNYHIEKEFGVATFPPASLRTVLYRRNYE